MRDLPLLGRRGPSVHSGVENEFGVTSTRSRTKLRQANATGVAHPAGSFAKVISTTRRGELDSQFKTRSQETTG